MANLKDYVTHYRKKLERGVDNEKALDVFQKLRKVRMTKSLLEETGIGNIVRKFAKQEGEVGKNGNALIEDWMKVIKSDLARKLSHSVKNSVTENNSTQKVKVERLSLEKPDKQIHLDAPSKKMKLDHLLNKSEYCPKRSNLENGVNGYSFPHKKIPHSTKYLALHGVPNDLDYDPEYPCLFAPEEYKPTPIVSKCDSFNNNTFNSEIISSHHSNRNDDKRSKINKCQNSNEIKQKLDHKSKSDKNRDRSETKKNDYNVKKIKLENNSFIKTEKCDFDLKKVKVENNSFIKTENCDFDLKNVKVENDSFIKTEKVSSHKLKKENNHRIEKEGNFKKEKESYRAESEKKIKKEKGNSRIEKESNFKKEKKSTNKRTLDCMEELKNDKSENKNVKNDVNIKSKKVKQLKALGVQEFNESHVTFEDCLGLNDIVTYKKKKVKNLSKGKSSVNERTSKINSVEKLSKKNECSKEKSSNSSQKDKKHLKISQENNKNLLKSSKQKETNQSKIVKENGVSTNYKEKNKSSSKEHKSKDKSALKSNKRDIMDSMLVKPVHLKENPIEIEDLERSVAMPDINPYYQPLPRFNLENYSKKKALSNEEAIMFTSSKKDRTAVYSGRRNHYLTEVPSLYEMCIKIVLDNITAVEFTNVPYLVFKPILERCSAQNLLRLEDYNPEYVTETDDIWEKHCSKDFRNHKPEECETWREMYLRIYDEQQKKLERLTLNIRGSMSASNPVRRAKLAYIDSFVKPPRDVARKQAKFGTGHAVNHSVKPPPPPSSAPTSKSNSRPSVSSSISLTIEKVTAPNNSVKRNPPKVAPLMAKTLKAMKLVYRR